jgi:hypothetical protein
MRKWTDTEDKMIIEYAITYKQNVRKGFEKLSKLIDRSNSSIVTRYYNKLSKKNDFKKYEHIFKNNTYLLDEPEVKGLIKLFDSQLKTSLYNILEYVNMSDVYLDTIEEREKAVNYFLNSDWFISVT